MRRLEGLQLRNAVVPAEAANTNLRIAEQRHDRLVRIGIASPIPPKRPVGMSKQEFKALKASLKPPVDPLKTGIGPTPEQRQQATFEVGDVKTEKGQVVARAYQRKPYYETLIVLDRKQAAKAKTKKPVFTAEAIAALKFYRDAWEGSNRSETRCALNQQPRGHGVQGDMPPAMAAARQRFKICESLMGGSVHVMRAIALDDQTYSAVAMARYGSRDRDVYNDKTGAFICKPAPRSNTHVTMIRDEFLAGMKVLVATVGHLL